MDKVEGRPIRWLWKDHLPFGTVSLIEGDPGLGKSQITMDLTSRITKGCPMPGEKESPLSCWQRDCRQRRGRLGVHH